MTYRIKDIHVKNEAREPKLLKARRRQPKFLTVLPPSLREASERINVNALFSVGELPEAKSPSRIKRIFIGIGVICRRAFSAFARTLGKARKKLEEILFRPSHVRFYFGALCAAITVAFFSASIVLLGLFAGFMRPYERLVIPELTGESFSAAEESLEGKIDFLVSYENSETTPAGEIISQAPSAGVTRRVYSGGKLPTVTVKVSLGRSFYLIENFSGVDVRTSRLSLKNAHVSVNEIFEYSDTVPKGTVISTSPPAGERLFEGEVLTLTISLGKYIPMTRVPDLYGLSESQARALLTSRGLRVGDVTYTADNAPSGKVISQTVPPYTDAEENTTVSFTVSLGSTATQRHVPDLYGLTIEEARNRLREVGLVLGGIFSVSSAAPKGTVVTQGFAPGTPITSTITSIDIYISS